MEHRGRCTEQTRVGFCCGPTGGIARIPCMTNVISKHGSISWSFNYDFVLLLIPFQIGHYRVIQSTSKHSDHAQRKVLGQVTHMMTGPHQSGLRHECSWVYKSFVPAYPNKFVCDTQQKPVFLRLRSFSTGSSHITPNTMLSGFGDENLSVGLWDAW